MKTIKGTKGTAAVRYSIWQVLLLVLLWPLQAFAEAWLCLYANHRGSEGTVHFTSNAISELRGWSLNESISTIDDTVLADSAETHQNGTTSWDGDFTTFWDETDTNGQMAATIGASVTLNLYPEGATTGDVYYTGTATITGIQRSAAINGMVEASYSFKGNGALTKSTVA